MNDVTRSVNELTYEFDENFDEEDDEFAGMTDEEIDAFFRPKKTNKRKSLAPLFVYLVLKEHSDRNKHLRQQDILNYLEQYPYEITMERKALSRIIHNLADSQVNICNMPKEGTWYENDTGCSRVA